MSLVLCIDRYVGEPDNPSARERGYSILCVCVCSLLPPKLKHTQARTNGQQIYNTNLSAGHNDFQPVH